MKTERTFLTTSEAARLAEVHPTTAAAWHDRFALGPRVNNRRRFDPEPLKRMLAGKSVPRRRARAA